MIRSDTKGRYRSPAEILFVHGLWAGPWVWEKYQSAFAELGFRSLAIDVRDPEYGSSRPRASLYARAIAEAASTMNSPILMGHSSGGLLSLKAAELCKPSAVVGICPAAPRGVIPALSFRLLSTGLRNAAIGLTRGSILPSRRDAFQLGMQLLPPDERERVYRRFVPEALLFSLEIALNLVPVNERRITCPKLFIAAEEDRTVLPRGVERIAQRYAGNYRLISGHGHMILIERGWENVVREIADWIRRNVLKPS